MALASSLSKSAHLGVVLRYAGMLEEALRECNTALALDRGNYAFRSCAWAAMELGNTQRAKDFIRLDAGSEWALYITASLLLREGKVEEAREAARHVPTAPHRRCLSLGNRSVLLRLWQKRCMFDRQSCVSPPKGITSSIVATRAASSNVFASTPHSFSILATLAGSSRPR